MYFIRNLKMVGLIDYVADIVTQDQEEEIMSKPTNREQVVCFLGILERRGRDAFTNFLVALENAECNFVMEHLEEQDQGQKQGHLEKQDQGQKQGHLEEQDQGQKQDCVDGRDEVDGGSVQETRNGNV